MSAAAPGPRPPRPAGARPRLVSVTSAAHWQAYHTLRRAELFEPLGFAYCPTHPDDRQPQNRPLLLLCEGRPIACLRIDLVAETGRAVMRTVAVAAEEQGQGYGRTLMALAEQYAREAGAARACVNALPDVVTFYEKCGYARGVWDPDDIYPHGVQMWKPLRS